MRKVVGVLALLGGVGGLSYWGANSHAVRMEREISAGAQSITDSAIHGIKTSVSGRDIAASGLADTQAEKDTLLAALNDIDGRRVVVDQIEVLKSAAPYTTEITKAEGVLAATGHIPHERHRALFDAMAAEHVTLASGAPKGWSKAVGLGKATLEPLQEGAYSLSDQSVSLTGVALSPAERSAALAALQGLPEGYDVQTDITLLDDGTPIGYELSFNASGVLNVTGKLPKGMTAEAFNAPLGFAEVTGAPAVSLLDEADGGAKALQILSELREWFPEIESAILGVNEKGVADLRVALAPGSNERLLSAAMIERISASSISFVKAAAQPSEGATRFNALTRRDEEFASGYWLPKLGFTPSPEACSTATNNTLGRVTVNFLSGSADLGPRATTAINEIAAVARKCALEGGLNAVIGGHTDNTGNADGNLSLSRGRAKAVVAALAERGVPEGRMMAIGYGQTEPIADNATEEGRAKNRRTTIEWMKR